MLDQSACSRRVTWRGLACRIALGLMALAAACSDTQHLAPQEASGDDWLHYGGSPDENHFSALADINDGNVGKLKLLWFHDLDPVPSVYSAPLAVGGRLYFAVGYSVVHAMDAATGRLLWKYDPEVYAHAGSKLRTGWGVRGIAYHEGQVFTGTLDGRLLAIDARTGRLNWSVQTTEPDDARYISGPPYVFNNTVVIGHGGADYGATRGYVTAYDIHSGRQKWRFYTVPGNPAKGFENAAMRMAAKTWTGEWWKYGGGGTVWHAMAYDPEFKRLYIGTGNGGPWNRHIRSPGGGDNLFLSSIVALNADTGAYVWHYQTTPGESWDFTSTMDIELATLNIGGKPTPVILHAPKNGFFYVLDRRNGKFISAEKIVPVNWATHIDPKTGRPVETAIARYPGGKPQILWPSSIGAHSVAAMSFSPRTGLVYIPVTHAARVYMDPPGDLAQWRSKGNRIYDTGTGPAPADVKLPQSWSALLAWNPRTQREAWRIPMHGPVQGGTLATAGNLVFQGNVEGQIVAYNATDGRKLWNFDAQVGIQSQPITYRAGGRQLITVIAGWRGTGYGGGPTWEYRLQHRRVLTFALDGKASLPPADRTEMPLVDDPAFRVDPAKVAVGQAVYSTRCMICHGPHLHASGAAPDLRRSQIPLAQAALVSVLHDGALRPAGMPSFEDLSPEQIAGLQHYIRQEARANSVR
ncbi:PQQ-dependent dehydrogenase, methanol/ethanol family [Sphingobium sp. EM0848]|uniref:PQQ-dependent dehydrogenase, methanol/ethanol family n=1 Tax=Sphingobium sp. EM0848 TaxID=2743473 RepID=UPI00350EA970